MRAAAASLFLIGLSFLRRVAEGHPLCYFDDRPTNFEQVLTFCPEPQDGACCNDAEEAMVEAIFTARLPLSEKCASYYKQVVCGVCHSYSAHLYEILGKELGNDGMMMKNDFCTELVSACMGEITFPTYEGMDYCTKHTGGGKDMFWSYPYMEAAIFNAGLTEYLDESMGIPEDPIAMHMTPDGSMWWIAGISGLLMQISADDLKTTKTIMEVNDHPLFHKTKEEGLLNFAFGPSFHTNNRFYVSFSVSSAVGIHNRLSRFDYDYTSAPATLASEELLLQSTKRSSSVHTAGWLGFKPSDYYSSALSHDLYWGLGDSGPQEDPDNNAQNPMVMHGTMMRITVPTTGGGYDVPAGNYVGGLPEICAIGFRNPWRCSFDRETEVLYCGDVGQTRVESINIVECGKNYGWGQFEGRRCQEATEERFGSCSEAERSGIEFPWFEYCHPDYYSDVDEEKSFAAGEDVCGSRAVVGFAVIGGYMYRGNYFADVLYGAYVFGDSQTSNINYIKEDPQTGILEIGSIVSDGSVGVISFAEDLNGELYALTKDWKIYAMPCGDLCATTCLDQADIKPTFQEIGCFSDSARKRPLTLAEAPACEEGKGAMSYEICASYCATKKGAAYFGVEYAFECFCGDADDDIHMHGELPAASCNYLCKGLPEQTCGGKNAMQIFRMGDPDPTPSPVAIVAPIKPDTVVMPGFSYLGCYVDSVDRVLTGTHFPKMHTMSTMVCAVLCDGSTFFGTQNGKECFCGDASDDYDALGDGTCDDECAGDSSETCGGTYAMDVYLYDDAKPKPDPDPTGDSADAYEYKGCFVDDGKNRVHSGTAYKEIPTMTSQDCNDLCKGSPFFATEFGNQCFCGMLGDDYDALGDGVCNFDCAGDPLQTCGGRDAMSVYGMKEYNSASYTYLGCFADNEPRVMSGTFKKDDITMTVKSCSIFCESTSTYFGLQNSDECFCGTSMDDPDMYGEATCDDTCAGDASDTCGGRWAMSVYQFDGAPVETPPKTLSKVAARYRGCYSDTADDRMMVEEITADDMTLEMCEELCEGSAYLGLQHGNECWCGDSGIDYNKYGTGKCDYQCAGDQDELCGGKDSMHVYAY